MSALQLKDQADVAIGSDDIVISSLPITLTAKFLGHQSSLNFRGICSVFLAYDKPTALPDDLHWLYYDSEKLDFNRVTESKKLSPFVAPEDKTLLTAEITFSRGDEITSMGEGALMDRIAAQAELANLGTRGELIDCSINWEPFVYPLQYAGYQEELAQTQAVVSQYEQLYSMGTGGDFNYADSQIIFHKAFDTVANLCDRDASYTQVIRKTGKVALNKTVKLGEREVGPGHKPFIIAEAGLNHNGSVAIAKNLIDEAIGAGCDAVKFQTFKAKSRVSNAVKAVKYAETIIGTEETIYEMFDRLAMPFEQQREIFEYARKQGIEIFSTPFDFECVDFLEELNNPIYKIASMDTVNLPLIEYVAKTGKPMIMSTGMTTLGQIEEAIETVRDAGNPNLILLHCNSSYPAALEEMNLKVINTLQQSFGIPVGLSDHTFGLFASHTALAIGAHAIERHFTLDRAMEGPDHILSSEPGEMRELVRIADRISVALGDGIKKIQPKEYDTINVQRKSLYAACSIAEGETINRDMISIKGPGGGLLPRDLNIVVGRVARQSIDADHPITWDVI